MGCKLENPAPDVQVWTCSRGAAAADAPVACSSCGRWTGAGVTCTFPLGGRKAGSLCGRALCGNCVVKGLCPPHARVRP